jgi:RhtB (resistance to homoserine/threonine) family protein
MGVHLWAFVPIAALVIIAPGPDTVLVTKNAVLYGRSAALATAFGVNAGLLVWTVAASVGLAAVVRESAIAFTVLKLIGAAYLVWLGLAALRAMGRRSPDAQVFSAGPSRSSFATATGFRQGLFSDLSNPKIAVFFTGLLPQFVSPGRSVLEPFLLLGGLFVLMCLVWLVGYALLAARAAAVFKRPRVKAAIDGVTGVVLVGLGVRLALVRR